MAGRVYFLATYINQGVTMSVIKLSTAQIRAARVRAGLTQAQAADALGVSTRSWTRWETAPGAMPERRFYAFCKAVGVALGDLPDPLTYDANGYPEGIDRDTAFDLEDIGEIKLREIEGSDYPERERARLRLYWAKQPDTLAKELAEFDRYWKTQSRRKR